MRAGVGEIGGKVMLARAAARIKNRSANQGKNRWYGELYPARTVGELCYRLLSKNRQRRTGPVTSVTCCGNRCSTRHPNAAR